MKVLISSCIKQEPEILERFLKSLDSLEKPNEYDYFFITTLKGKSKEIFDKWCIDKPVTIKEYKPKTKLIIDEYTHHWSSAHVDEIIKMKRFVFDKAKDYDYLYITDSDNKLHPKTLTQLISRKKDIISEMHWTKWGLGEEKLPNAWMFDKYGFYPDTIGKMKLMSLIEVGGFGGNALVSKKAIEAGVCYDRIDNLHPEWGEDRHFSIRAKVLGFKLWCDSVYPINHMYRSKPDNKYSGVLISIPHTGKLHTELVSVLMNVVKKNPFVGIDFNYGMPVDSNRNHIVKKFLKTNYEWLLMIDSDIVPPVNVLDLLKHGKKIIGAVCFTTSDKGIPYPVIMERDLEKGWGWKVKRDVKPLMEVDATGASCLLIHRDVLEKIKSPFRFGYDEDGIVTVVGEDFDFCQKAKKLGHSVWVDTTLQCKHYKELDLLNMNKIIGDIGGR